MSVADKMHAFSRVVLSLCKWQGKLYGKTQVFLEGRFQLFEGIST